MASEYIWYHILENRRHDIQPATQSQLKLIYIPSHRHPTSSLGIHLGPRQLGHPPHRPRQLRQLTRAAAHRNRQLMHGRTPLRIHLLHHPPTQHGNFLFVYLCSILPLGIMILFARRRSYSRNRSTTTTAPSRILAILPRGLLVPRLLSGRQPSTSPPEPEDERDEPA